MKDLQAVAVKKEFEGVVLIEGRKQFWRGMKIGSICTVFGGVVIVSVAKAIIGK